MNGQTRRKKLMREREREKSRTGFDDIVIENWKNSHDRKIWKVKAVIDVNQFITYAFLPSRQ